MIKKVVYDILDRFTFNQNKYLKEFERYDKMSSTDLYLHQMKMIKQCCKLYGYEINTMKDFYKLPITTKEDLWETKPTGEYKEHETSGSTGEPRKIYVPVETWYRKDSIFSRSWKKMGRKKEWVFRLIAGDPKYPIYDWWRNVKPMNYRTIGKKHVDWVIKNKPYLIHGPGGAIRQLCELIIKEGRQDILNDIKIHWCSESSEGHKQRLEPIVKEFHEQYGLAEMPTVAATDGKGNLKIVRELCYVEILDDNGKKVKDGKEGYIVVTDFNNTKMPIIRYKSGDRGKIKKHKDGYYILYDVIGRGVDFYDGPEVKKPVGWWIVSPISHTLGHIINQWRVEVVPKKNTVVLHYKGKVSAKHKDFRNYRDWIKENLGLKLKVVKSDETVDYGIYWKNKLVRVIND